ncbi:cupredoxin family copper-binding protein [Streptomyces phaeochromogenes]|uniref:cupredoxin domain-containing protein n=1 Tax=Streptomyces phaeochromogenes TaxID=1923 RepID=UPI002252EA85|nr:cupredoxin family copper-binding protein [Streptomyces phaeochromogenes]MCX5604217.1 cupredoxin family copper-binding protein [Streptomyces phaeochromogenes]
MSAGRRGRRGRRVPPGVAAPAAPAAPAVFSVLVLLVPLLLLWAAPGPASAATYRVAMKGYAFSPAALTVPVGSTVTWTNQDTAPHDVKTTSGPVSIHSPMLQKGQSWSFTFTTAGSYGYYCTVHPDMTARIVVQAAPTPAAPTHTHTESDGHESGTGAGTGAGSGTGHHTAPTTSAASPAGRSKSTTPTKSPSAPPTSAPAAAAAPSAAGPAATPQAMEPTASARPLDGLLVLAEVVAGVAVLCLLLVGSRSAAREKQDAT